MNDSQTRDEIRKIVLDLQEGDEVEVGMTWGKQEECRAAGVLYRHSGGLCLFGYAVRWDSGAPGKYITYIRVIKKAPMPEPTLVGTVVITADNRKYIRYGLGVLFRRWVSLSGSVTAWGDLDQPRILTPDEVAVISAGGKVEW